MDPQENTRHMFLGDIKLPGDNEFARKFNQLSDLWQEWKRVEDTDASEEVKLGKFNDWFEYKFRMESGY